MTINSDETGCTGNVVTPARDYTQNKEQAVTITEVDEENVADEGTTFLPEKISNGLNSTEKEPQTGESCRQRATGVFLTLFRCSGLLLALYLFICSLDLLSSSFTLLAGRAAGGVFQSPLLQNPICGLMLGVVFTALLQSSSTSTSIIVTMVAANMLSVQQAIPFIMGANIGTSVTGILVAVAQAGDRSVFSKAFAAATVHDMFNWLSVAVLLPIEVAAGYLFHLTSLIVNRIELSGGTQEQEFLRVITKPLTERIVQIDKAVLEGIALGKAVSYNSSLLRYWCETEDIPCHELLNTTQSPPPETDNQTTFMSTVTTEVTTTCVVQLGITECEYLFHGLSISEQTVGAILLLMALTLLIVCLLLMVKLLKSLLQGRVVGVLKKTINSDFPGFFAWLTGYVAILVGAVVTILVQSSSVVASTLTPLVGVGMVTIDRVFPMMLGANLGTTSTAILASFAATGDRLKPSFQIALCHLFFNLSGILIWYPVFKVRQIPIKMAMFLGDTSSRYRWFAVLYLITLFFILPGLVFALSIPGWYVLAAVGIPILVLIGAIIVINIIQHFKPEWLPRILQTWNWLPLWLRSLEPMDNVVTRLLACCSFCRCCKRGRNQYELTEISLDTTQNTAKSRDSDDVQVVASTTGLMSNGNCSVDNVESHSVKMH